ncbi:MAG: right-handed parallel beta-helix repeat-containing protein [Candidatus Limnocylindrales bacterium]
MTPILGTAVALLMLLTACTPAPETSTRPSGTPDASPRSASSSATPSSTPAPVTVLAAGDIGECGGKGDERTAALLAAHEGTILPLGDLAYESGTTKQFADCFGSSWGVHRERMRPVPGNHDYETPGAAPYYAYFGKTAGDPDEGWYAYDLGAWRLYALNSNCEEIGGCEIDSPQQRWLQEDLATHPATCILAYWHHARFSSGELHADDPRTDGLWQTLAAAGADVVLSAHDHDYERFAPRDGRGRASQTGIREFVVGTGGSGLRAMGTIAPTSEAYIARVHGVLSMQLRADGYDWTFLPVEGKTATDTGSGLCTPIPEPASAATASPRTLHVASDGDDSADGSAEHPMATIQAAVDVAAPGSTIRVGAGQYGAFIVDRPGLTILGESGDRPRVQGPVKIRATRDVHVRGFDVSGVTSDYEPGLGIERSSDISLGDLLVHGNSFGIELVDSDAVTVTDSEVTDNASGIEIHGPSERTRIEGNRIVANGRGLDRSRGGTGVNLYFTSGVTVADNEIGDNHTADRSDGVGVEIYGSSDVAILDNRFHGNLDVLETGTDADHACRGLTIMGNVAWASGPGEQHGMILRCAADSLVAHNTLVDLDLFAFDVSHRHGRYGASVGGLRIVNNIAVGGRAFSIDSRLPKSVVIDHNLVRPGRDARYGGWLAFVAGHGNTRRLAELKRWTGFQRHGIVADPRFRDPAGQDFTLQAGSPAIDRGVRLADRPFEGLAPDLGSTESAP